MPNTENLIIEIGEVSWRKIMAYTKQAKGEVGGVAPVTTVNGLLRIGDPILPKQVASTGHVSLDDVFVHNWLTSNFPDELKKRMPNVDFCLWHSHGKMAPFFSGTDEDWIAEFVCHGRLVSLVVNHHSYYDLRVDTLIGGDIQSKCYQVTVEADIDIVPDENADPVVVNAREEFKANVKEVTLSRKAWKNSKGKKQKGGQTNNVVSFPALGEGSVRDQLMGAARALEAEKALEAEIVIDRQAFDLDEETGLVTRSTTEHPVTNGKKRMKKANRIAKHDFLATFREDGKIEMEDDNEVVTLAPTLTVQRLIMRGLNIDEHEFNYLTETGVVVSSDGLTMSHKDGDGIPTQPGDVPSVAELTDDDVNLMTWFNNYGEDVS